MPLDRCDAVFFYGFNHAIRCIGADGKALGRFIHSLMMKTVYTGDGSKIFMQSRAGHAGDGMKRTVNQIIRISVPLIVFLTDGARNILNQRAAFNSVDQLNSTADSVNGLSGIAECGIQKNIGFIICLRFTVTCSFITLSVDFRRNVLAAGNQQTVHQ